MLQVLLATAMASASSLQAQETTVAPRAEGEGPWPQLIIRGVTLINGTLSPPLGPVDIEVRGNRITSMQTFMPDVPVDPKLRPKLEPGGHELSAEGMYLLPGFVDTHVHYVGWPHNAIAGDRSSEYIFKLWLAHGVTTVREVSCSKCVDTGLALRDQANRNDITAPRIRTYLRFGRGLKDRISTPEQAVNWVRENARLGADGIKFSGGPKDVMTAAARENARLGLRSTIHAQQLNVGRWNVLDSARAGIDGMEHWYGLPESMLDGRTVQNYSPDHNWLAGRYRYGEAGELWQQAARPGSPKYESLMNELIELDFTITPTFRTYLVLRDAMAARRAEWHDEYTTRGLMDTFTPSRRDIHNFWYEWGTEGEVQWRRNYRLWMDYVNEYKNRGGRVAVGTDSGYLYNLYGFGYIHELELLREAGFHPLEVIKAATLNGAEVMGLDNDLGSVDIGKLADFVIVEENPLRDLKVLYGTGAIRVSEDDVEYRTRGIRYIVKDGIVYDSRQLLDDVRQIVHDEKSKRE